MIAVEFLSDDWFAALSDAAAARVPPPDDPLAEITLIIGQQVDDGPSWQLVVDHGQLSVRTGHETTGDDVQADVRLSSDRATAAAIASGTEAALDAFMVGRLRVGGDVQKLVEHRAAFEAIGDIFASVRSDTTFETVT